MKIINTPKEAIHDDLINTKNLYFVVGLREKSNILRPNTYEKLIEKFGSRQTSEFVKVDAKYRSHLINHHNRTSFLHGSIAGFSTFYDYNNLFDADFYTYYFKLTIEEIKQCAFSITNDLGEIENVCGGVEGIVSVLKKYASYKNTNDNFKSKTGINGNYPQINIVIPFKIKPHFCLEPAHMRKYYHGSTKKLDKLNAWTYVTPYKEDAKSFAIPWSSEDLVYCEHEESEVEGRPPQHLLFKTGVKKPRDRKIYIYEVVGPKTIGSKTNTGKEYPWNRVLVDECKDLNVEVIDSWKKEFNIK